jgi:hypothetical protein
VGFRIRHAWLFLSRLSGLFGPLAPVVVVEGGPRAAAVFFHSLFLILESFSSAEFGRRPKCLSRFCLAANSFARDQWAHLHQLGVPAAQEAQEEDDNRRPKWDTAPPTTKKEWKSSIGSMKKMASTLTEPDASAPFRASLFPSCLLHAEADLKPNKDFKEATLQTNVAGACGLALVRCGEMAFSALGKDSDVMKRLHGTISRDSPQDVDCLLSALRDTQEDLADIRKGLGKIANVGSSIAAGSFNQGVDDLRHLVWESSAAKAIRPTLELCQPSLTHLFGDKACIKEALEAAKHKPYQAAPFRSKFYSNPRTSDSQEERGWRKKTTFKKNKAGSHSRSVGKANGPASKKGEGQKKK